MKSETKIEEELRRCRDKLKQLERERQAVQRRRIAQEQKRVDRMNMLLGRALVLLYKNKSFESIKERLDLGKDVLIHRVQKKGGEIAEDDTDFRELMAYLDEMITSKKEVDAAEN
jgi:chromosome segregation ATPase